MGTLHIVRQGECLSSIAHHYGLATWRSLYDHPDNAALRELRPDPNVLYPGDEVHIPDREEKEAQVATEARHRFKAKREPSRLRLQLRDRWGNPMADHAYRLSLPSGPPIEGETDGEGRIDVPVPPNVKRAVLVVSLGPDDAPDAAHHTWRLHLGGLDPVEKTSGVQARLANLGYDPGRVDGKPGPKTRRALVDFQVHQCIRPTGEVCDATRGALRDLHPA